MYWPTERVFERCALDEIFASVDGMRSRSLVTAAISVGRARDGAAGDAVGGRAEFARYNIVEDRFEVVQEDGVGCALEHERKPPVWIDSAVGCKFSCADYDIRDEEDDRECHAKQHDAEARVDTHQSP